VSIFISFGIASQPGHEGPQLLASISVTRYVVALVYQWAAVCVI
jgi:hypothetical protein